MGAMLLAQGEPANAAGCFQQALKLNANYPEAHFNLGAALQGMGDPASAIRELQEAIRLRPSYARAHAQLGQALFDLGQVAASVPSLQAAARLNPSDPAAFVRLGESLRLLGTVDQAMVAFDEALRLRGDDASAFAARFHLKGELCLWEQRPAELDRLWANAVREMDAGRPPSVHPMYTLSLPWLPAQQLAIARAYVAQFGRASVREPHPSPPRTGRLKIGYLSRDFYDHPVAHQLQLMFGLHDRRQFEVHVYSFGPDDKSEYRRRIERDCEHFLDVADLSLSSLAQRIRDDGIHILVDLMGHTGLSRLACLTRRPAPIQAGWLGYPATIGADFLDYIIGDPVVTPPESAGAFSEKIVRLPHTYMVTDHRQTIGTPMSRADQGLPEDAVVFCCFHNAHKIEPLVFDRWMRVAEQVPGSVLWLSVRQAVAQANLRREAQARGVDPNRLIFAGHVASKAQHLARLRLADLFLDTHCYNAHVTACDALWAGLPVLTCPRDTFASRVCASLLTAVGLRELIAPDLAEYERLAVTLARDRAALPRVRQKLADQRQSAPLFDTPRFVRNLERAYGAMWEVHAAGQPPRAIDVREEG